MDPLLTNQAERAPDKRLKALELFNAFRAAHPEMVKAQGSTATTTIEQRRMYRKKYRAAHPEVIQAQKARARARAKERSALAHALANPPAGEGA